MIKIGILREGKTPPDSRVTLTPTQCGKLNQQGIDIVVQPSPIRCFPDQDYIDNGVTLQEDMSDRDFLIGVKEVQIDDLIDNKSYFFFSHTIKEQSYNQKLLKVIVEKRIRLIDYEVLTNEKGSRVIAFGKFAGMVGAYNALWTYGKKTQTIDMPRLKDLHDYTEAKKIFKKISIPKVKIVLTGTGRVSGGAALVLDDMGIKKVSPLDYLMNDYDEAVYTQLSSFFYTKRKDGKMCNSPHDFYNNPKEYQSEFSHFLTMSDIMINGIYWDNDAPKFFTKEQMSTPDFNLKVIADVTCDIAPISSIPSTIKASTIANPVFGYDPITHKETLPYTDNCVDMMTIDNLPNELPRDASKAFGEMFIEHVLNELNVKNSTLIEKATIAKDGNLGKHFEYLRNYLNGK
ncbi:MAG: NAD(P)-dependent oxidoreductase [Saprospiraceae bacterium]